MKKYNFEHLSSPEMILIERYVVNFLNKDVNIPPYLIKSIQLPKFSNGEWEELQMDILNLIDCSTIIELNKIVTNFESEYLIEIELLDPVGHITGTWILNCKIIAIDFGNLDYDSKDNVSKLLISKIKFKIINCKFKI